MTIAIVALLHLWIVGLLAILSHEPKTAPFQPPDQSHLKGCPHRLPTPLERVTDDAQLWRQLLQR